MLWLLLLASLVPSQAAPTLLLDASRIEVGAPVVVANVNTDKLKGDVRRLAWAPDGTALYLQTVEGKPPAETAHHYSVALAGGLVTPLEAEPEWASSYWITKQDQKAPGLPALTIEIVHGSEQVKTGTGGAGLLDRESTPDAVAGKNPTVESLANGNMGNDRARVVRLTLLGEDIAKWVNERPRPGQRFSWGPAGSGTLVHVTEKGELRFLDKEKRRQEIHAVKNAILPAWSTDGKRLACLEKTGRKTYRLAWMTVNR